MHKRFPLFVTKNRTNTITTTIASRQLVQLQEHTGNDESCTNVITMCKNGGHEDAMELSRQQYLHLDSNRFACLLQGCAKMKVHGDGKYVHAHIIKAGSEQNLYLGNNLVSMYTKCGSLRDARRVFDRMSRRSVVSWTAMIAGYAQNGHAEEALELFNRMQCDGVKPDNFTFSIVVKACAGLADLKQGRQVHAHFIRAGFESDNVVKSALVDMYAKCGSVENAHQIFDKMTNRNVVSWTAMIAGFAQNGFLDDAQKLFCQMPKPDTVTWTALIAGYAQNGDGVNALKFFSRMLMAGVRLDHFALSSALRACATLAALEHGKQVHAQVVGTGFESSVFVGNALVDMYAKCGIIEDALDVFDKMPMRDLVSWTAMIVGCAQHGRGKDALQLFDQMLLAGLKPNKITFVGLLYACSHAGLVDEGRHYFDSMSREYGIAPTVEHYTCMLDLLGRAGCLDEAEKLVNQMPVKPDATIWGALLGACRIHGNIDIGKRTADRLLELKLEDSSTYVLLSNIYAAAGRWDDVAKVRKLMVGREVKKQPGCSWIEVKNRMHVFFVGDISHPRKQEIHAMLESLAAQMKEAGYMPDTNFVLHEMEEQQKEYHLCYHSEKLAVAFGLISTLPRTTIRVVKNIRVCGDCHTALKFICKIVEREIIVRDANRFHHFKDGQCSCRDYW
eukprot:Gb_01592 [translate_table: standard]